MWDMTIPENQRSELPVSARCILFQDAWRLPESIAFWNEGKIEVDRMVSKPNPRQSTNTSGGSFAVVSAIADAYPPYNQGFTNATYEVVSTTNVEGNTLPTHFKITKFSLKKNAKSNADLSIAAVVEAWVTNLTSNVKRSGIQPALSTKTRVVDQRVTQHGNISAQYQATGQKWLTLEESKSLPSVLESLRRAKARKSKLALIFLAFALISAAPIVMLLRKRRGNATE